MKPRTADVFLVILKKLTAVIFVRLKLQSYAVDQCRYIKIQPKTRDLGTRHWGITTEFVGFIAQSLMPRSVVSG